MGPDCKTGSAGEKDNAWYNIFFSLILEGVGFFFFNTWYSASLKSVELHRGKTDKRKLNLLKKTYYYGFEEVKLVSLVS